MINTAAIREQIAKAQLINDHQILDLCRAVDELRRDLALRDGEDAVWQDHYERERERVAPLEAEVVALRAEVERLRERSS